METQMLIPLKQWICDSCGQIIEKSEDGWWEYLDDFKTNAILGFRIVHHQKSCMYDERPIAHEDLLLGDLPLNQIIDSGGFGHMLHWLELSETKKLECTIVINGYIEVMRRLYLPYWEEARQYWEKALKDGFHDGCDFSENTLINIITEYGKLLK
jgi:hypothetical protein